MALALAIILSGNPPVKAHGHTGAQFEIETATPIITQNDKSGCLCCDDIDFAATNGCSRCCALGTQFSLAAPPAPALMPRPAQIFVEPAGLLREIEPPPPRT